MRLLLLDQFEDLFLYHGFAGELERFSEYLAQFLSKPPCRLRILISIRDDAFARLDYFKDDIPETGQSETRYQLYHDVLAKPVLEWSSAFRHERELAQERAERQTLIKRRRLYGFVGVAGALLVVLAGYIFVEKLQVEKNITEREGQIRTLLSRAQKAISSMNEALEDPVEKGPKSPNPIVRQRVIIAKAAIQALEETVKIELYKIKLDPLVPDNQTTLDQRVPLKRKDTAAHRNNQ